MWTLAKAGARAHRGGLAGTALALGLAATLLTITGVLLETGLRVGSGSPLSPQALAGAQLTALASSFAGTALVVVLIVVATTVSLALRQRRQEFALLRAVGATRAQVRGIIAKEALQVGLVAVPLGALPGLALARALTPVLVNAGLLEPGTGPVLSPLPVLGAVAALLPTALAGGWLAARETLRQSPTAAVRDSAAEEGPLGTRRRVAAAGTAVLGLAAAFTPLVVPGVIGSAAAASSALLLVGAAALAGPALVGWSVDRLTPLLRSHSHPPTQLAAHNLRGFSRRLAAVVVPLALVMSTGVIQTSTDAALARATQQQLDASLRADIVVGGGSPLPTGSANRVAAMPGVRETTSLSSTPAQVRIDDEDLAGLAWETVGLRVVSPDAPASLLDPAVSSGSLSQLSGPDTIAVSSDAALETGAFVGDSLEMRLPDGQHSFTVVAVFDRGLGLGPYLIGDSTARDHEAQALGTTLLVGGTSGDAAGTARLAAAIDALGLPVTTTEDYVGSSTTPDMAEQRLETLLLLMLLAFVTLGAANALVLTTLGRRREFALLHRTGATRRQLVSTTVLESFATGAAAWVIGAVTVLPGILGVSLGLLGATLPVVDLATVAALSCVVIALPLLASVPAGVRVIRGATRTLA
ncbi:FtsX-like permease family protein [Serinicoccus kebangsaanensis]|uniref:FtsX-like permease family protein n=1 Tax=Serinicoccus kebangsaanensis TaxID=2602069 RepID=UPI001EE36990|nr:ABC transporter permease [Serinicoccus kebangsaanensis]